VGVRRLGVSVAMLVGGFVLLAAAVGAPAESASGRKGGTLRWAFVADVDSVDPGLAYFQSAWMLEYATCAKLFNYPDQAGAAGTRIVPEVVDRFTVSKDGKVYSFDLKQNFRFHSGAPVIARSFADALNRAANPRMQSPAISYMHEIVGADAVMDGKATTISGVRVLGRYRLQIRLSKPLGDFTARLTMPFFCPLAANTPIDPAGIDNPAGSGPYYVAERIVNRQVVLRRNRFYRGGRPANVDEIVFTVIGPEACRLAVEQDEVDYCGAVPPAAYRELAAKYGINRPGGQFFVAPALTTWYFAFNHDRPAFKGPQQIPLKKAINHALDRPALTRALGYLAGKRTDQLVPPVLARDADVYSLEGADPATARKWLARARIKPSTLVLYAWTIPSGVTAAQVFAFNLKQIGIDVEVKYFAPAVVTGKASTRGEPYDVVFTGWNVDYGDPAGFYVPLLGRNLDRAGHANWSYFVDPAVNARIAAANRLDGDARRRAWAALEADLMRSNPPWAPFAHATTRHFVSRSLGCIVLHPAYGGFDLGAACKK
jgi:ABC-type oligopeptide transport system substrate-binding subunit